MAPENKTNRATPSLAAEVERPVTNTQEENRMSVPEGNSAERHRRPEPTLFDRSVLAGSDEGLVRHEAPDTSRAAALRVPKGQRAKVMAFINEHGPSTDVEIAEGLGLSPNSERPRRVELVSGGFVKDSGERREHHGSPHIVWVATDAGRAVAGQLAGAA
jgi:hypothetical protein